MTLKNKTNQKLISSFLVILILAPSILFFSPGKASAVPTEQVSDTAPVSWLQKVSNFITSGATTKTAADTTILSGKALKDIAKEALQEILKTFARRLLAQMTQSTVNWINSGFHGSPLFLERPGSFFKDIAKSEIRDLVSIVGYNSTSYPFGKSAITSTIDQYKSTFAQNAQYSLSKVVNDPTLLNNFRNDFSVGGWDGFMINTQFPQNNYVGFQMIYANELARRLQGTTPNQADLTSATLAQGGGFLSPQKCETNPNYNNLKNQFQQPTFKCSEPAAKFVVCTEDMTDEEFEDCDDENAINKQIRDRECNLKEAEWEKTNLCPARPDGTSGFVNTTPGSVVGASIMKAVTGPYDQTSLAAAMGNSLSAIFDALLNKFMSSGLNALSGNRNNTNNDDTFDYDGHTLGSPTTSTTTNGGFNWNGPDEEVVLSNFKLSVQNAIDQGNQELKLIDNNDFNNPGIMQMFAKIWPKAQELDMCLPGPDLGWQARIDQEAQKNSQTLESKANDTDREKAVAGTKALNELNLAVSSFKQWISNKMNNEIPSSSSYVYAVESIKATQDQALELTARKNKITDTLIKLQSINGDLSAITTQPVSGSTGEATMVRLKQRLDTMLVDLSSTTTVNEMQNTFADAKDKLSNLGMLINRCQTERQNKGWTNPGGDNSKFNNVRTEEELFCSMPIEGGYTHAPFFNHGTVTHPEIPLLNADNVYPDSSGVSDSDQVDIELSCDVIFKAYVTDYKKNLPN